MDLASKCGRDWRRAESKRGLLGGTKVRARYRDVFVHSGLSSIFGRPNIRLVVALIGISAHDPHLAWARRCLRSERCSVLPMPNWCPPCCAIRRLLLSERRIAECSPGCTGIGALHDGHARREGGGVRCGRDGPPYRLRALPCKHRVFRNHELDGAWAGRPPVRRRKLVGEAHDRQDE